ncbi:portal protein [Marinobacterium litorale]|uniref:portal protein n=1 Tax=Marinobacterium litorale TaxID=404770 RepID=UPI0004233228|nr:hypothetical protein [Marinobacterium litorale]
MSDANQLLVEANAKLTSWEKQPSIIDLKRDYEDAKIEADKQIGKIDTWLDNLHVRGAAVVKSPEGSSRIVPKVIRKQAEWRYAALSEPFLSTDDVFNVTPVTYEDREAAIQNQLVLNHQFNNKINKTKFIDEYVRTAVDEGTVIVRVGWDFEEETYTEMVPVYDYVPTTNPQIPQMYQYISQVEQTDPSQLESVRPELLEGYKRSQQSGQLLQPVLAGEEEQERSVTVRNQPTLEICNYRNVVIDPSCNGEADKANFFVYSFESSIAELQKDGRYKNLNMINITNSSILGDPDHESQDNESFNFQDNLRKRFIVREYWGLSDIHGTGNLVPIVAAWVGDALIRMEESPFPDKKLPFVIIPYLPVRKSLFGEPDGALLEDNQKVIGAVTRGMIDIMGKSANGQTGVRKDALDFTNKRKFMRGEDYEYNGNVDPRVAFHMHTYPEIPASAQVMLQLQNNEAESLTGVKAFNNGVSGESLGDVAAGVRGALDAASKRELGILRRLAAGIIEIGRKFISMNAVFLSDEEVVRITNEEFVTVRRDDLSGEFDLKLSISTAEEDNAKAQELAFMLQTMGNTMDPEMSKMLLSDIARLRKMPDLAKRIENYQPQPNPMDELQMQLLQAQIQKEMAIAAHYSQARIPLDQAKVGTEQAKAANLESETDLNTLDFVEQEAGVKQERDLEKQGAQARANAQLEVVKAALQPKPVTTN